jgi:capsular exopolysaccharide synthesis family protein
MSTTTASEQYLSDDPGADSNYQDADDTIDLRQYLLVLRKYRWFIILTTAVLTGITAYIVSGMTPIYRATSTLLIETQQTMPMNLDDLIGIDTTKSEYYQTQFEVLKSRKLAKRVLEEMGLYEHREWYRQSDKMLIDQSADGQVVSTPTQSQAVTDQTSSETSLGVTTAPVSSTTDDLFSTQQEELEAEPIERQLAVNRFMKRVSVTPIKNTKLVRISFESDDPVLAARIANKIADTYILSYMDSRMEMSEKATSWLASRLTDLKIKLEDSQNALLNYKEAEGLVDYGGAVSALTEQEIGIVTGKLLDAEARMAEVKILYDEVTRTKERGTSALLGLPVIDSNEMVRRFKIGLQEAQFNLDELQNRYGDKHPKVIDATSRRNTARSNLNSQILNITDSIEKDYQLAQQSVESLQNNLNEGKKEAIVVGRSRIELMHLEREVELNQKLYDTFYTRIREVDEAENMSTTNAQIAEYAEAPISAVKPKKSLIVLLSLLASLAAAIAIAITRETMNDTVKSAEDVEKILKTKMLGIVPLVAKKILKKHGKNALVPGTITEDRGAFAESIRTVRTSVCLNELAEPHKVIMVTSALPGEGKSTLASHLAHSLSQVERVLLIECDMRRPSLHRAFDFENTLGLAQLLTGEAQFIDCIKLGAIDDLDVIPAGSIPDQPLELLGSKRFKHLINQMKKRYDRIVIDSAPVQAVSDALILGQMADTVLYAVKANSTTSGIAARGIKRLRETGINVAGAVVTQVNIQKISSYGGDLGYQGYYDYYGYSEDDPMAKALVGSRKQKPPRGRSGNKDETTQEQESKVA